MSKFSRLLVPLAVAGLLTAGCAKKEAAPPTTVPAQTAPASATTTNPYADKVSKAIEKTKNVSSLRFSSTLEKTSKDNVPRIFHVTGSAEPKARRMETTVAGPAFSHPLEVRALNGFAFVKVPPETKVENTELARVLPAMPTAQKPWIAVETGELRRRVNASAGANSDKDQMDVVKWASDPAAIFDLLGRQLGETKESGLEKVRGADTLKYTVTIEVRKALANANAEEKDKAERAIKDGAPEKVTIDIWIDNDSFVRKVAANVENRHPNGPASTKADVELYDFGAKVDITAPGFGEVTQINPAQITVPPKGGSTTTTTNP